MNRRDRIEGRAEAFGDKDHPCCEGFNCYVCVAHFTRTETATLSANNEKLREALRELCEAGDKAYYELNNAQADLHTESDCHLCEVADPLGDALTKAKALLDTAERAADED